MLSRLLEHSAPVARASTRVKTLDTGFDAISRFAQLARDLVHATHTVPRRSRWNEPNVFFFDRHRQTELEASRHTSLPAKPFAELAARIAAELLVLTATVELRHIARATKGLMEAAAELKGVCPEAGELAALLAIPDDEVVTVLQPKLRVGFRMITRGVADIGQFHILMADAIDRAAPQGWRKASTVSGRLVAANRDAHSGERDATPLIAEARCQFYTPAALLPNGELPAGFAGSDHWLWPQSPFAMVPRIGGERVLLMCPPAFRATWEVTRRFPTLAAEVEVFETLGPVQATERLSAITGQPLAPLPFTKPEPVSARAA